MRTMLTGVLLCALVLAGCDSLFDTTTIVYGTVVDKQSGAPLSDISVALVTSGAFGAYGAEASTVTDARGKFSVSTDFDKSNPIDLFVNSSVMGAVGTYNEAYGSYQEIVRKGRTTRRQIKL